MKWLLLILLVAAGGDGAALTAQKLPPQTPSTVGPSDDFDALLERLRQESPGEYAKVRQLAERDRASALRFLRQRFGGTSAPISAKPGPDKPPAKSPATADSLKPPAAAPPLPARHDRFEKIETINVGEFTVELCRRDDGAFGLGEIRRGPLRLRRTDFLVTWRVDGKFPRFERREGLAVRLRDPVASVTFAPERRASAGTGFTGFSIRFQTSAGPVVETASWELGGDTRGLDYIDGYRGWHAPPSWTRAAAVPETNPKLLPSLLHGTGFQFEHGRDGALLHFHTTPGDRLRNASRGAALEFETTHDGAPDLKRFVFVTAGGSRTDLWTRAFEVAHAEMRGALGVPEPTREIWVRWPPFSRKGFRETAVECAGISAREGFSGVCLDVIWDNADFHGGKKNMNVRDYAICPGYGGEAGLHALMDECRRRGLRVNAWTPAGHLWSASPVWPAHPDWLLKNARGENFANPSGNPHGALDSGFRDYYRERVVGAVKQFGFDGLWLDTHLGYAQQWHRPQHGAQLASLYLDFIRAGARQLLVEGDAAALGAYSVFLTDDHARGWKNFAEPELFLGASIQAGFSEPRFYREHFRRFAAAGAPWVVDWDFLHSPKLAGPEFDAARREALQVVQDYARVKDRMAHRFAHADGSGYTWTNDRDAARVVWLLADAPLPDGRRGEAGKVYLVEAGR
ncbi:MAG: hypothetical protein HY301_19050 [Verrucomicrobia bacterium]|nr:hypothetical protein [Verrucomicrobiota bacterium]